MRNILFSILLLLCIVPMQAQRIVVGAEQIDAILNCTQDKHLAVVANQASLVGKRHLVDTLLSCGADVRLIMSPEHGFRGDAEAGAHVQSGKDAQTGLPILSLYGNNKKPSSTQLQGITLVIFDLQDVGCRFYTYISTLHYVMEACAENNIPLLLLDRPNPNASYVDGPVLDMKYQSFVGMHPVPIVYGMTIGEYAGMINGEHWLDKGVECDLTVIPLRNYTHDSCYHLPVAPSPNLQTDQAIALYPSLCLFEGTNISVGRGTDFPFEVIGSPYYKAQRKSQFQSYSFTPRSIPHVSDNPPFKGKKCHGIDLRKAPKPDKFDLAFLIEMYRGTNGENFFLKSNFFEKLAGNGDLRQQLKDGISEAEIRATWAPALSQFKEIRQKYLIYK